MGGDRLTRHPPKKGLGLAGAQPSSVIVALTYNQR